MRPLGVLPALLVPLVLLSLAGCGADDTPTASDTGPTASATASDLPTTAAPTRSPPILPGGVRFELREVVSAPAGRGVVSTEAVPLTSTADVDAFTASFSEPLALDVHEAVVAGPPQDGQELYGAVVSLGCDIPPGVDVTTSATGFEITGSKVPDPMQECFAPVTSVAIVAIAG